jgi:hypothetical protein
MLLFHDDLAAVRDERVALLRAQAAALLGDEASARTHLAGVLADNPCHMRAALWRRYELDGR